MSTQRQIGAKIPSGTNSRCQECLQISTCTLDTANSTPWYHQRKFMPETATKTTNSTNQSPENKKHQKKKSIKGTCQSECNTKVSTGIIITNQADVAKREEQRENKKNRLLRTRYLGYHPWQAPSCLPDSIVVTLLSSPCFPHEISWVYFMCTPCARSCVPIMFCRLSRSSSFWMEWYQRFGEDDNSNFLVFTLISL